MREISLTQGKFALVDDEDFAYLNQWKWSTHSNGYAIRSENRKMVYMHRLIVNALDGMDIDHINGDGLDNRRSNLRICSHMQNMRNMKSHKDGSSKYKGVCWHQAAKKWVVSIYVDVNGKGKNIHLGLYKKEIDAAIAYNLAAVQYYGKFAKLNEISRVA